MTIILRLRRIVNLMCVARTFQSWDSRQAIVTPENALSTMVMP
jgi:hypothetical protein